MHKYGIQLPKSVKEACEFNEENSNSLWRKGIEEDIARLMALVAELTTSLENLVGCQKIYLHTIVYIKLGKTSGKNIS